MHWKPLLGVLVLACLCGDGVEAAACFLNHGFVAGASCVGTLASLNQYLVGLTQGATPVATWRCYTDIIRCGGATTNKVSAYTCLKTDCATSCTSGKYLEGTCTSGAFSQAQWDGGVQTGDTISDLAGCFVTTCTPCTNGPSGSYYTSAGTGTGVSNCAWACSATYYKNGATCIACSSGTYSAAGATACSPCTNAGTYGTYSGAGTTATNCPVTCNGGTYLSNGTCTPCAVGTYSAGGNATACTACTKKTISGMVYTTNAASDSCQYSCQANYYQGKFLVTNWKNPTTNRAILVVLKPTDVLETTYTLWKTLSETATTVDSMCITPSLDQSFWILSYGPSSCTCVAGRYDVNSSTLFADTSYSCTQPVASMDKRVVCNLFRVVYGIYFGKVFNFTARASSQLHLVTSTHLVQASSEAWQPSVTVPLCIIQASTLQLLLKRLIN